MSGDLKGWAEVILIAVGMAASLFLSIDHWVHGRSQKESDHARRITTLEFDVGRQKKRASEKANEQQVWVGRVDVTLAEHAIRLTHLEHGSGANHRARGHDGDS